MPCLLNFFSANLQRHVHFSFQQIISYYVNKCILVFSTIFEFMHLRYLKQTTTYYLQK